MANGPLSRGLLGAVDIETRSQQLQQTQQQINQRQSQAEMSNALKMINLGIDLEDDALTQSGLDVVNKNFGTTIDVGAIGENRKVFQKQFSTLVEEGKNLRQNPEAVPAFRQAVNNFNLKYSVGKFAEQAEAVTGAAEPIITGAEEAEALRQRGIARGIPQEGELTPLQIRQQAAIAGGLTPAQVGELGEPPTLTELKAEVFEKLPPEDKRRILLKPEVEINLGKPPSPGERTAIAETEASIDALNNLKSLFDTDFVGPAGGRIGAIKNIFGLNPVRQEGFIAATAAFRNQVIKQITGAQMSEPEAERIMKQIPNETDAPSVWLSKYEQSIKNLETINSRRREVLRQVGLKVPGGETSELDEINRRIQELEGQQ